MTAISRLLSGRIKVLPSLAEFFDKHGVFRFIAFALVLILFSGCSGIARAMMGIKKSKPLTEKRIARLGKRYGIAADEAYQLDTAYLPYVLSLDTSKYKLQIKNHYQPLQALYYEPSGRLVFFYPNCYAGGFPNLNWNRAGTFETFLPRQQAPADSLVPLAKHAGFINDLNGEKIKLDTSPYDYIILVHWNRMMSRQSKRLIRYVRKNAKLAAGKKIKFVFVNNDNSFYFHSK